MARIFRGVVDYGEKGDFYYTRHGPNETDVHSTILLTDRPWYYQISFLGGKREWEREEAEREEYVRTAEYGKLIRVF